MSLFTTYLKVWSQTPTRNNAEHHSFQLKNAEILTETALLEVQCGPVKLIFSNCMLKLRKLESRS